MSCKCKNHGCECKCPSRPNSTKPKTLTFENCTTVAGSTFQGEGNVVLIVDPDIEATVAGSFENTSNAGFNVLVILNSGPAPAARTVEPGDSFTFVYNDVSRIALFALVEGERYTGIFKYQLTYTFDVQ